MDSENGGLSSEQKQRQAAAEIARRKVLMAYDQEDVDKASDFIKRQNALGVSATPVLKTVSNEEWKRYHTAWQDYYQKYYSEYYMNAAKQYVAKQQIERVKAEPVVDGASSEPKTPAQIAAETETGEEDTTKDLKSRIQEKAKERDKRASRRRKLMPLIAGLTVCLTILFLQYNRLIFAPIAAYVSPGEAPAGEIDAVDPTVTLTKVSSENKLIIPKLNVDVPLNFGVSVDGVMNAMNYGVVHYRINGASAYPGEIGNFVVMGHSAGDVYSANQYKFIFSGLERLEEGDIMYVHYNSVRYTYRMVGREVILPTEVSKLVIETNKPMMTLVTCWPLGTSQKRLLISAEQIAPSYEGAVAQEETVEDSAANEVELPKNEDTLFDRIRKGIFGE